MTDPKKPKNALVGGAAFVAGLVGGNAAPPVVVEGVEPSGGAWECKVVGSVLNGQRICKPKQDDEQTDSDTPIVSIPDAGN